VIDANSIVHNLEIVRTLGRCKPKRSPCSVDAGWGALVAFCFEGLMVTSKFVKSMSPCHAREPKDNRFRGMDFTPLGLRCVAFEETCCRSNSVHRRGHDENEASRVLQERGAGRSPGGRTSERKNPNS
jgi:hypothetical protein